MQSTRAADATRAADTPTGGSQERANGAAASLTDIGGGLKVLDTSIGKGLRAQRGDKVSVKYKGLTPGI